MLLYDFALAPNPRRVRMFLAEKGIEVPMVQVNTRERQQFTDEFRRKNPWCSVPVLELEDGTCICESVAICRYLEETHPEPPLMGRTPVEKAVIEMWNRRAELDGFLAVADVVRHSLPMFADRSVVGVPEGFPQVPEVAEQGRRRWRLFLDRFEQRLGESRFVAGDTFTIADITTFVTLEFAKRVELEVPETHPNLRRFREEVAARPSAAA